MTHVCPFCGAPFEGTVHPCGEQLRVIAPKGTPRRRRPRLALFLSELGDDLRHLLGIVDRALTGWLEKPWTGPDRPAGIILEDERLDESWEERLYAVCMTAGCTWQSARFWQFRVEAQADLDDHHRTAHPHP